jgi:urease accessory protein UreF
MGIFTPTSTPAQQAANQIMQSGNQLFTMLVNTYNRNYKAVWSNANATPADVVTAMGTQAALVFAHSAALATLLNGLVADSVTATIPAGYTVTVNGDNSVTVTGS